MLTSTTNIPIITSDEIKQLRAALPNPLTIICHEGGQEKLLLSPADITIYGGNRGGGKTHALLMEALRDCHRPNFRALIMRNEKGDLSDMIETSYSIYSQFGYYNKSKDDMTWNFDAGGFLQFDYFAGNYEDFAKRFQGKQFCFIGIDEITHIDFEKFKYIITDNRNAYGFRNRFIGTCNPDPRSWVARFIDWWIGEDGYPIEERDGVIRYCFMDGDDVASIIWGDTREEVYQQAKGTIDRYWTKEYERYGTPQELFIKSVCFIRGRLSENVALMQTDPAYLASLANQSEAQRARDLEGNWRYYEVGREMVKLHHLESFFNAPCNYNNSAPYASCDIAFSGGDNLVLCLWTCNRTHLQDIYVLRGSSKQAINAVKAKLDEWGVPEQNFTYDLNGLGQSFKGFFPHAVPFNNLGAVDEDKRNIYANLKSQAAYMFAQQIIDEELSINPDLLDRKYSGNGYTLLPLRNIIQKEIKVIRRDEDNTDHGFALPKKAVMKRIVGHSPDFVEAMMMIEIFNILKPRTVIRRGLGFL